MTFRRRNELPKFKYETRSIPKKQFEKYEFRNFQNIYNCRKKFHPDSNWSKYPNRNTKNSIPGKKKKLAFQ